MCISLSVLTGFLQCLLWKWARFQETTKNLFLFFHFLFYKLSKQSKFRSSCVTKEIPLMNMLQLNAPPPWSSRITFFRVTWCIDMCTRNYPVVGSSDWCYRVSSLESISPRLLGHNAVSLGQPKNGVVRLPLEDNTKKKTIIKILHYFCTVFFQWKYWREFSVTLIYLKFQSSRVPCCHSVTMNYNLTAKREN